VLFEISAAFAFGWLPGVLLSLIAKTLGASIGFIAGRTFFRKTVREKLRSDWMRRISDGILQEPFTVALLLRLSPIVPSWMNTYALASATSIQFSPFLTATVLGSILPIAQNCLIGSFAESIVVSSEAEKPQFLSSVLIAVGLFSSVVLAARMFRILVQRSASVSSVSVSSDLDL